MIESHCKVGVAYGPESKLYSFPGNHPMNFSRAQRFFESLEKLESIEISRPLVATEQDLLLFHDQEHIEFVKEKSRSGSGYLDHGDTPAFEGIYEASLFTVGSTLNGLNKVLNGTLDHFFNPIGGLNHARKDRSGGFCVFNDAAVAIAKCLRKGISRVAYVDIDAHHGDGVYYGFEDNENVIISDIHEDGHFLFPGTGFANEIGVDKGSGTKMNVPLPPGSGDQAFMEAFEKVEKFIESFEPQFILMQCGADGLRNDPITHLEYTERVHAHVTSRLHELSHRVCEGRIVAMGGGGYNPGNVKDAWIAVIKGLLEKR